jgi:multidrug efflux pump subunit AcrB
MLVNLALVGVSAWLFITTPKGFFPQEDTGLIFAFTQAEQDISFQGMAERQQAVAKVILADPDVASFGSSIGGNASAGLNTGRLFISLQPFDQRSATATEIIQRLRPKLAAVPGIAAFLQSIQYVQVGARLARTQYQYTLLIKGNSPPSPCRSTCGVVCPSGRLSRPSCKRKETSVSWPPCRRPFQGTAQEFQNSLTTQPLLIAAALFAAM